PSSVRYFSGASHRVVKVSWTTSSARAWSRSTRPATDRSATLWRWKISSRARSSPSPTLRARVPSVTSGSVTCASGSPDDAMVGKVVVAGARAGGGWIRVSDHRRASARPPGISRLADARLAAGTAAIAGDAATLYHVVSGLMGDGVPFETVLFDVLVPAEREVG